MNVDKRVLGLAGERLRVLISASPGELSAERDAAHAAVRTLRLTPVLHEPGASGADVTRSDVFVGIYWESYGWVPPGRQASAIEDEYERCAGHPRLVYVKEPAPQRDAQLDRLVERMRAGGPVVCRTFATPGELAELLIDDLAALVSARFYADTHAAPAQQRLDPIAGELGADPRSSLTCTCASSLSEALPER